MLVNCVLGTVAFAGCCALGFQAALRLDERHTALKAMGSLLKHLQKCVEVSAMALPEALEQFAGEEEGCMGDMCWEICRRWREDDTPMLPRIWAEQAKTLKGNTAGLTQEDVDLLCWIGEQATRGFPGKFFQTAEQYLAQQQKQADEERHNKGKLYRTLGGLCGAALFILVL